MSEFEFETKPKRGTTPKAKSEPKQGVQLEEASLPKDKPVEEAFPEPTREERALYGETRQYKIEDFEESELIAIFDTILFEGDYTEEVTIGGKLRVKFRTRSMDQINAGVKELDKLDAKLITTIHEARSQINLRQALVEYQGTNVDALSVEEKNAFFGRLPSPIVARLLDALRKFDIKVSFACAFGDENF